MKSEALFHCFGGTHTHRVDTATAVAMLESSGCKHLAINTHNLAEVERAEDLAVGYGTATLGSVMSEAGERLNLEPVLNINHAQSAEEAVARTRRAAELTGLRTIKLEVLGADLKWTLNSEVRKAANILIGDGFEVWPLLTAELEHIREMQDLGCTMLRVMGSGIGSYSGISGEVLAKLGGVMEVATVPLMLDGGVGKVEDAIEGIRLGFDSVLVNSCLFGEPLDPVGLLSEFRKGIEEAQAARESAGA